MTMTKKNTAIAAKADDTLSTFVDYGEDTDEGYDNQEAGDLSIPLVTILQALSPQIDQELEGAKVGRIWNSVTEEALDELEFVPAYCHHVFTEWLPDRGGYQGEHPITAEVVKWSRGNCEFGKYKTPEGNDLIETYKLYGVTVGEDGGAGIMFVTNFCSNKIRVYKKWNTKLSMFQVKTPNGKKRPPLFCHTVKLTTTKEDSPKGSFFNAVLSPAKGKLSESLIHPDSELYQAAKACREMILSGNAKSATPEQEGGTVSEGAVPF